MPGIACVGLDVAGGSILGGGQSFWSVEGAPAAVLGDAVAGHGNNAHAGPVMASASSWMSLNGIPVCRAGDVATCGHAASGRAWFTIA